MPRPAKITEEAIELTIDLLARRVKKTDIKAILKRNPHALSPRSCERVLAHARERMIARVSSGKEPLRADAMAYYEQIILAGPTPAQLDAQGRVVVPARPGPTIREKLLAQQGIRELLGLDVPQRVEVSGPNGGAIKAIIGVDIADV